MTNDDIIAAQRRAFDLRHERRMAHARHESEREWAGRLRHRDWRAQKAMRALEPHRVQKDHHVLENVIGERNEYFMDSMKVSSAPQQAKLGQTRPLPPEIRSVAAAAKRTFYWGT
jgi:hypothetical protein